MAGRRDVPVGEARLQARGPRGGGGAAVSGIGSPGRAAVGNARAYPVRTQASWGLRALANAFQEESGQAQQLMRTAFRERAREVENQQTAEGAAYGLATPIDQLRLPAGDSIGDEAFRKSAILAASTSAEMAARDDIEKLAKQHPGQPEAFKAALQERAQAFVGDLDPAMQPEVASTYNRIGAQRYQQIDNDRREYERDQYRATILEATNEYTVQAAKAARNGDWDAAQAELAALANKTTAAGPQATGGSGALSLVEIEKLSQDSRELIQDQFLQGWVERAPNPYVALKGLQSGKTGSPSVDGVLAASPPKVTDRLAKELEGEIRTREAEARQAAREAKAEARAQAAEALQQQQWRVQQLGDEVSGVVEASQQGVPLAGVEDLVKRINAEAARAPNPDVMRSVQVLNQKLDLAMDTADYARQVALTPTDHLVAEVERLRTTPSAPDDALGNAAKLQVVSKVLAANQEAAAKGEVLDRAGQLGIVKLAPIDPGDPASIGKRVTDAHTAAQALGTGPNGLQYLRPQEATALVSGFKNAGTVDERLAMLAPLTVGPKDDEIGRKVLSQLEGKGLPADARFALERLKEGDEDGARQLLAGLGTDPKDLPKLGETTATKIADAVDAAMADPSNAAGMTTHLANTSQQPAMFARAAAERETITRLATQYASAGASPEEAVARASRFVVGDKVTAGSDDLGMVTVPNGADVDAVTAGMAAVRAGLDLSHLAPRYAPTRPGQATTGATEGARAAAQRDYQAKVEAVRRGGMWTPVDGGYALMGPTGWFVPDPADPSKPRVWTLGDLTAAGQRGSLEASPPSLGPLDTIHGDAGLDRLTVDYQGATPLQTALEMARRALRNTTAAASADIPVTAEQAAALGIPVKGEQPTKRAEAE